MASLRDLPCSSIDHNTRTASALKFFFPDFTVQRTQEIDNEIARLRARWPSGVQLRAAGHPIARGDALAVQRHVEALAHVPADVGDAYHALARRALRLAAEGHGLAPDAAAALRAALGVGDDPPRR